MNPYYPAALPEFTPADLATMERVCAPLKRQFVQLYRLAQIISDDRMPKGTRLTFDGVQKSPMTTKLIWTHHGTSTKGSAYIPEYNHSSVVVRLEEAEGEKDRHLYTCEVKDMWSRFREALAIPPADIFDGFIAPEGNK